MRTRFLVELGFGVPFVCCFAQEAIVGRSKGLASQATEQYRKRMYKSLQSSLVAMKEIQTKFSAVDPELDQLQNVLDQLERKILGSVKALREEALSKLKEGGQGSQEPEGFANNLITLGLVAFEIPTFKAYVLEQMNELLNTASTEVHLESGEVSHAT